MAFGKMLRKKEHREIKFSDRTRPGKGVASVMLALLGLGLMAVMIFLSAAEKGAGEWYVGVGGMIALVLVVIGFVLAVRCFRMENVYYGTPLCGAVLNGVLLLVFLSLYAFGVYR